MYPDSWKKQDARPGAERLRAGRFLLKLIYKTGDSKSKFKWRFSWFLLEVYKHCGLSLTIHLHLPVWWWEETTAFLNKQVYHNSHTRAAGLQLFYESARANNRAAWVSQGNRVIYTLYFWFIQCTLQQLGEWIQYSTVRGTSVCTSIYHLPSWLTQVWSWL